MNSFHKLVQLFTQFPGIGPRQAKRFVYFLLSSNPAYLNEFADLVRSVGSEMVTCSSCFRFFNRGGKGLVCEICRDESRDNSVLAIVSHDIDYENIEKTRSFNGYYFILGGSVAILEDDPEKKVRIKELLAVVEKRVKSGLREIILATSFNAIGENTADYMKSALRPLSEKHSLKITALGRGLSLGTELEYSDSETLTSALKNRG